ncbi:MAG: alpha-galactosidase, partial [Clostridia bacterium]|nr:alpha-galactosidase [Clostridia bacterium]
KGNSSAQTLEAVLYDDVTGLEVRLFYTVFDEYNIIARNVVFVNKSDADMEILRAYSMCLDLPTADYNMIHFAGSWGRERDMINTPLKMGIKAEAANARGGSGHQMNPFVMITSPDADEERGEVYGFSLIYSGNHSTVAEVDEQGAVRVMQGINPYRFKWELAPGESFYTPQSVLCYSDAGFGKMSREYHDVYRNRLMKSKYAKLERPILINNWEGTYFNFTEKKLIDMAKTAKAAGVELFVLDDGWFGKRNDDRRSLGDWKVNYDKLPSGLDGLAKKINALGMKFGLWFEPEMVNPDSELYRLHPDWAVKTAEREPVEQRNQLILDLSRDDVCQYIINAVSEVLKNANIEYVKWDMNRQMTDMPYVGYNHKYILGYYRIMSAITSAFPDVLFEGCSAGGGRFDPGVLAYMPQIWTSDNSDAVARLKIQYATSMCYPVYSISSHVTASPNHQCGRVTTLKTRADVAYAGTFGYELDITAATDAEFGEIQEQIAFEKDIRAIMCHGDLYRLKNPFETNYCAWEVVSEDKSHVFVFACRVLVTARKREAKLKLAGLEPDRMYKNKKTGMIYGGDMLMYKGISIDYKQMDFATDAMVFELVE